MKYVELKARNRLLAIKRNIHIYKIYIKYRYFFILVYVYVNYSTILKIYEYWGEIKLQADSCKWSK